MRMDPSRYRLSQPGGRDLEVDQHCHRRGINSHMSGRHQVQPLFVQDALLSDALEAARVFDVVLADLRREYLTTGRWPLSADNPLMHLPGGAASSHCRQERLVSE